MVDATTKERLIVQRNGESNPTIRVLLQQLDELRAILDENEVRYWVSPSAVSINGSPMVTSVVLYRSCDPDAIQKLLDAA